MLETTRLNPFLRFDGEVDLVQRTEDLVHFADARFVLEVDWCVEVGDFGVDAAADEVALGRVEEGAHFCNYLLD